MRTHYCGQVTEKLIDQEVEACGWVNKRRDHGGVIFVDLRDREGILPQNKFVMNMYYASKAAYACARKAPSTQIYLQAK